MNPNYDLLPEHMRDGMERYIKNGVPPGDFLTAVLENNLIEAFGRADHINEKRIRDYVVFLYNEAPPACYGSPLAVKFWIERGGWNGD